MAALKLLYRRQCKVGKLLYRDKQSNKGFTDSLQRF
jgi:hypothetical protein